MPAATQNQNLQQQPGYAHTAGPWTTAGVTIKCREGIIAQLPRLQDGGVYARGKNAKLIVKAPDLLAALKEIVGQGEDSMKPVTLTPHVLRQYRDLIIAAEGRS